MEKINVCVLFGGLSSEHDVSKASVATVVGGLSDEKYNIIPVYITMEGAWLLYDGALDHFANISFKELGVPAILSPDRTQKGLLRIIGGKVKRVPVDVVFPVLHGANGEDGTMQGLLELCGLPYVGSGVLSSALCMDKCYAKMVAAAHGVKQAPYLVFMDNQLTDLAAAAKTVRYQLGYPCFVKPANTGSSVGISKARNKKELVAALELAARFDRKVIVEKAVSGREMECSVLGPIGGGEASVVGEVIAADEFYSYDAKYHNEQSQTVVPADIPEDVSNEIRKLAVSIYGWMDCSGLARADFFVEAETNAVIFNEINTLPGFTSISMYFKLWNHMGVTTPEVLDRLIAIALGSV